MQTELDQFLTRSLRGACPAWPAAGFAGEDSVSVMERISLHGIALLLSRDEHAMSGWPADLRDSVLSEARTQQVWEISHHRMLSALLRQFADAGVAAVVMKGTALAYSLYPDPAMRRRGDTDLLVHEGHLAKARQVLDAAGLCRRGDPHGVVYQEGWLHHTAFGTVHGIDLHWRTCDAPLLEQVIPTGEILDSAGSLPRLCAEALGADPVLTFLQVALNWQLHRLQGYLRDGQQMPGCDRLIWACDFDLLARSFTAKQWDQLAGLALDRDVAPVVRQAMQFAQEAFATPVPDDAMRQLDLAPKDSPVVAYLGQTSLRRRRLADFLAARGAGAKLGYLRAVAFPGSAHLREQFPAAGAWPLAILYLRWWWRNLRQLAGAGGR